MRLRTQVLTLQLVVIAISLGVGFALVISGSDDRIRAEYGRQALAIAQTVAQDPEVVAGVRAADTTTLTPAKLADGVLQRQANTVRAATGATFVVIADDAGIRLAHPSADELGKHVSTDSATVLRGQVDLTTDRGTLGESVRAKVPIRDSDGAVIGLVSVGVSTQRLADEYHRSVATTVWIALGALAIGALGSVLLARRWQRLTLGLQPYELAELVREQRAVLHSLADGVVAVDVDGVMTVVNEKARALLSITAPTGTGIDELGLTPRIRAVFDTPTTEPLAATVGERIVLVSSHRVAAGGQDLGMVVSVLDRTDVEELTREVDSIQAMSTALRAQRHETANRMHVLAGLLRHGEVDAAQAYLDELTGSGSTGALVGIENVDEPHLQAFLEAKAAHGRERGVSLRLGEQTWVLGRLTDPVTVTAVLGNLVDNAVEAAAGAETSSEPAEVEVELIQDDDAGGTLLLTVADSGPGIEGDDPEQIFVEGVTTKAGLGVPGGRGMGLAIVRQLARRIGGDVVIADPGGPGRHGAVLVARLPGVIATVEPQPAQAQSTQARPDQTQAGTKRDRTESDSADG